MAQKKYRSALHEITDYEKSLLPEWTSYYRHLSKSKKLSSGTDGISFKDIQAQKSFYLKHLAKELLNSKGKLHAAALDAFPIPKANTDSFRIICIPSARDRFIQRVILNYLKSKNLSYETEISYGCSKEKSVNKALDKAVSIRKNFPWVYKTDITKFFDQIDRNIAREKVIKNIRHKSLLPIFFAAIEAEISDTIGTEAKSIIKKNGIKKDIGIRQGLPFSPLIANLFLKDFDRTLIKANIQAIRYADDLIVFCESKSECFAAHNLIRSQLALIGLNTPDISKKKDAKTRIYKPNETVEFLGLGIEINGDTYRKSITSSQIQKVEERFSSLSNVLDNANNKIRLSNVISKLSQLDTSYEGHFGAAHNYSDFEKLLLKWKRRTISKIFSDSFSFDVNQLTPAQKYFFHIADFPVKKKTK